MWNRFYEWRSSLSLPISPALSLSSFLSLSLFHFTPVFHSQFPIVTHDSDSFTDAYSWKKGRCQGEGEKERDAFPCDDDLLKIA